MKSDNLTLLLVACIFVLLLVSVYYNNYTKEYFSDAVAPGTEVLTKIKALKIQMPNDSEHLGFKAADKKTLLIKDDDYSGCTPIIWNSLVSIYPKVMNNRVKVDEMIGNVFKSTKKSLEAMTKLRLQLPTTSTVSTSTSTSTSLDN